MFLVRVNTSRSYSSRPTRFARRFAVDVDRPVRVTVNQSCDTVLLHYGANGIIVNIHDVLSLVTRRFFTHGAELFASALRSSSDLLNISACHSGL